MLGIVWLWLCGWCGMLKQRRKGQKWPPENSGICSASCKGTTEPNHTCSVQDEPQDTLLSFSKGPY